MNSPAFAIAMTNVLTTVLAPVLSAALGSDLRESVKTAVQEATKSLQDQVKFQSDRIDQNEQVVSEISEDVGYLKEENNELHDKISELNSAIEELEQYGRRNSLRFHNVAVSGNTDEDIVKLCNDKLNVTITTDDICRSHTIGRPNRFDKSQVICRFRNWKIKNLIYSKKRLLKDDVDHTFITEDLTRFRQAIVSEMMKAKRAGKIVSFWSNDGRLFVKDRL